MVKKICLFCRKIFYAEKYASDKGWAKYCSRKCVTSSPLRNKKISLSRIGEKNVNWKGDSVGYKTIHMWVSRRLSKPIICPSCNVRPAKDLANISPKYNSKTYNRNLENWEWLCRKCHMEKDGRLKLFPRKRILPNISCKNCNIEFIPRYRNKLFCTWDCFVEYMRKKKNESKLLLKV